MTKVLGTDREWQQPWAAVQSLATGSAIGIVVFGGLYVLYGLIEDPEQRRTLTVEDGFFEWLGACAFLLAAGLQLVLFRSSDVPADSRLIAYMRRNPFYVGLALVLFFAFAEEISWGQRVFGWATPDFLVEANTQDETNLHNLAGIEDSSLLNLTRLFNLFSLAYVVLAPLAALVVPFLAYLYRRVSLPLAPLWVGGLFLGHFASWRIYSAILPIGRGDEIEEAFLAICWLVLGAAQLVRDRRLDVQGPPAADQHAAT
jgi:hypothetical protein